MGRFSFLPLFEYNCYMANIKDLTEEAKRIEKQLDELDKDTLTKLVEDQSFAEEYARETIQKNAPEKLTAEYIKNLASEMQIVAKMRLRERFYD